MNAVREIIRSFPEGKQFSREELPLTKEIHLYNGLSLRCNAGGFKFDEKLKVVSCVTPEGKSYTVYADSIKNMYRTLPEVYNPDSLKNLTVFYPEAIVMKNNNIITVNNDGALLLHAKKKVIGIINYGQPVEIDANEIESYTIEEFDAAQTVTYIIGGALGLGALYLLLLYLVFSSIIADHGNS
jgi:hypothetical protein